ncbi:MAG: potassium channel protein [Chloroflexi bacterium]|nr:potassium channel protein [Chloroflexota bacterium]
MERLADLLGLRVRDLRRVALALVLITAIVLSGMMGYHALAELDWLDALYMTIITMSTVGFGEYGQFDQGTRTFTIILIIMTMVWGAWALQALLGTFLSPHFFFTIRQKQAVRRADRMENHTILCGYGRIGRSVATELSRHNMSFVVVEKDADVVAELWEQGLHVVHGDATEDEALIEAGVKRARYLLAVLDSDTANIVTVLSARELNPNIWISARVVNPDAAHKLHRAGANDVVSPYEAGGRRLAITALRPHVSRFMSEVLFNDERGAEMDEMVVHPNSILANKTLGEVNLRRNYGITVIALFHPEDEEGRNYGGFELNPGSDAMLHAGDVLIVVGNTEQLRRVHHEFRC